MIPLQRGAARPAPSAGGPEDVFGFLYWLMNQPTTRRPEPVKPKLRKKTKRLLRLLKALDAARALQLARANAGIFMSA